MLFTSNNDLQRGSMKSLPCEKAPWGAAIRGKDAVGKGETIVVFSKHGGKTRAYPLNEHGEVLYEVAEGDWIAIYNMGETHGMLRSYYVLEITMEEVIAQLADTLVLSR